MRPSGCDGSNSTALQGAQEEAGGPGAQVCGAAGAAVVVGSKDAPHPAGDLPGGGGRQIPVHLYQRCCVICYGTV